jgi:hypothetical protein
MTLRWLAQFEIGNCEIQDATQERIQRISSPNTLIMPRGLAKLKCRLLNT